MNGSAFWPSEKNQMNYQDFCVPARNKILDSVVSEFIRGIEMIDVIDDAVYTRCLNGTGSVGGHFRHNLDFAGSFLNGVAERRIDYNHRERDMRVETDRRHAEERFIFTVRRLRALNEEALNRLVIVRSEVDVERWHTSTVSRELEFLHSHTVHHHALIAEKLRCFGITVPREFGVAPSTLEYWKSGDIAA